MPSYKATLTGVGPVNNAYIYLEMLPSDVNPTPMPIFLKPKRGSQKTWENESIRIEVNGKLDYELRVHAFYGTKWTFKLTNTTNSAVVISESGETGSKPADGLNVSFARGKVDPIGNPANPVSA